MKEAYRIEEVSTLDVNKIQEDATKGQNEKYQNVIILSVLLMFLILTILWYVWREKNNKRK